MSLYCFVGNKGRGDFPRHYFVRAESNQEACEKLANFLGSGWVAKIVNDKKQNVDFYSVVGRSADSRDFMMLCDVYKDEDIVGF